MSLHGYCHIGVATSAGAQQLCARLRRRRTTALRAAFLHAERKVYAPKLSNHPLPLHS